MIGDSRSIVTASPMRQVTPRLNDPEVEDLPLLNLTSNYILRSMDQFPRQGSKLPWRLYQNYIFDTMMIRFGAIKDDALEFKQAERQVKVGEVATA